MKNQTYVASPRGHEYSREVTTELGSDPERGRTDTIGPEGTLNKATVTWQSGVSRKPQTHTIRHNNHVFKAQPT